MNASISAGNSCKKQKYIIEIKFYDYILNSKSVLYLYVGRWLFISDGVNETVKTYEIDNKFEHKAYIKGK